MSVSAASLISCSTFQLGIPNRALFFQDKCARGGIYCCSSILNTPRFLVFFLSQGNSSCSLNKSCIINNNLIIIEERRILGPAWQLSDFNEAVFFSSALVQLWKLLRLPLHWSTPIPCVFHGSVNAGVLPALYRDYLGDKIDRANMIKLCSLI